MNKQEIKALVAAKIAGQGNQVDIGGALATIIDALIDLIPESLTIPIASAETLGGVKVGENLSIDENGVLSSSGGGGDALSVEGQIEGAVFTPTDGTPFDDAVSAFVSGRGVIILVSDGETQYMCVGYSESLKFITGSGSVVTWAAD